MNNYILDKYGTLIVNHSGLIKLRAIYLLTTLIQQHLYSVDLSKYFAVTIEASLKNTQNQYEERHIGKHNVFGS